MNRSVLLITVGFCLACAGLGESAPVDAPPEAPATEPDEVVMDPGEPFDLGEVVDEAPPEAPPGTGLATALGIPLAKGRLLEEDEKSFRIIHPMAWDITVIWDAYQAPLVVRGFERMESNIPPFESLYETEDQLLDLKMTHSGTSVIVEGSVKPYEGKKR